MRKNIIIALTLILAMLSMAGCGESAKIPDTYQYEDLSKYIELGDFSDIKYEEKSVKVTKAEVDSAIQTTLDGASETKNIKKGVVKKDSVINVDYVGKIDGKEFDGGSASSQSVDIANSSYIDGFAEGMVGHKVGETFDVEVTFPDDYSNTDYAGKDAVFTITVNSIESKSTPTLKEYVKNNTEYKSVDAYKKSVKEELISEKETEASNEAREDFFMDIVDKSKLIEYPEKELKAAKQDIRDTYSAAASNNNMSLSEYLEEQLSMTEEKFSKEVVTPSAQNKVKQELVLRALAEKEGLEFTDSDYEEFLKELLDNVGITADQFKSTYGTTIYKYAEQQNLYGSMLYEKVMDAVITESEKK